MQIPGIFLPSNHGGQIFLDTINQNEGKIYQITTTLPNGHKIYQIFQMNIKYTSIFHSKALQNLPKLGFFKNKPSGNPASN
jgi:hypothetical protein